MGVGGAPPRVRAQGCSFILSPTTVSFLFIHAQLQELEMQSWVELVGTNVGSNELDADEFNFGAMPDKQASTEALTGASPPLR
jgi:hypothetical protein